MTEWNLHAESHDFVCILMAGKPILVSSLIKGLKKSSEIPSGVKRSETFSESIARFVPCVFGVLKVNPDAGLFSTCRYARSTSRDTMWKSSLFLCTMHYWSLFAQFRKWWLMPNCVWSPVCHCRILSTAACDSVFQNCSSSTPHVFGFIFEYPSTDSYPWKSDPSQPFDLKEADCENISFQSLRLF